MVHLDGAVAQLGRDAESIERLPSIERSPRWGSRSISRVGRDDGAVAQLGERLLCKQEVIGSIPFGSTSLTPRFWPLEKEEKLRTWVEDLRIVAFVLWLFDIVDRMQSTLGRMFRRAWWRLLLCA